MLLAVAESERIQSDLIPKIATGFCGGVSRTCGMCGAVSGGIMVVGLFTGRSASTDSITETYRKVQKLLEEFRLRFGSTNCRELTGCDLGTDEGQEFFKKNDIKKTCRIYTEGATGIALSLVEDRLSGGRRTKA
ncbi:MAG TPA: C-GCAxxG-C-C family protein [Desulfomonilaceae bacterium]|nr:C-GCAxxG-C-C family protein [Desulfomonilaceae bacterium]